MKHSLEHNVCRVKQFPLIDKNKDKIEACLNNFISSQTTFECPFLSYEDIVDISEKAEEQLINRKIPAIGRQNCSVNTFIPVRFQQRGGRLFYKTLEFELKRTTKRWILENITLYRNAVSKKNVVHKLQLSHDACDAIIWKLVDEVSLGAVVDATTRALLIRQYFQSQRRDVQHAALKLVTDVIERSLDPQDAHELISLLANKVLNEDKENLPLKSALDNLQVVIQLSKSERT